MTATYKIQLRRDTPGNWQSINPVLAAGEVGVELVSPVNRAKVGDGVTAWNTLAYAGALVPTSTRTSPVAISASVGVTPNQILRELQFILGTPGAVTVTANPQVAAGTIVGQELYLICVDAAKSVTFGNGNGLNLNGPCTLGGAGRVGGCLVLMWDGAVWNEVARNDI